MVPFVLPCVISNAKSSSENITLDCDTLGFDTHLCCSQARTMAGNCWDTVDQEVVPQLQLLLLQVRHLSSFQHTERLNTLLLNECHDGHVGALLMFACLFV